MPDTLTTAIEMHQTGQLASAAQLYQQVLTREKENADALHLLGVLRHQQGDHVKAVELIRRAIALRPSVPAFHANLAEAYRAQNQFDRAAGCCRTGLRLQPDNAAAANNLGLILLQQGKAEDACAQLETALRLDPHFALASNNLGNAWRQRGDQARALACFHRAVELDPRLAQAHSTLGQLLLELERPDEALPHCREAVRLADDSAECHNNLGNVLRALGQFVEARACYAEALRLRPDLAQTLGNMGQVLQQEGQLDEAIVWYRQALEQEPNSARLHCYLARTFVEQENWAEARGHYETAIALEPDLAEAHNGLGWLCHEQGELPQARECYRAALRHKPDYPAASYNWGLLLTELGELSAAEETLRAVLARHGNSSNAYAQLAALRRGRLPDADRAAMQRLLADANTDDERRNLHFGLAAVSDGRGERAEAVEHLRRAHALAAANNERANRRYDADEHRRFVEQMRTVFSADFLTARRHVGSDSERPIFIVGFPRSGTTLTEQILANHPRVFAAGELPLTRRHFLNLSGGSERSDDAFAALTRLTAEDFHALARQHLEQLQAIDAAADRIVDKMPDNSFYLGLLALLFPRARFIHCRRDPRDTVLSCWMTSFRHIRWNDDLDHLLSRYQAYCRLMAHWRRVLPVPLLEIDYEETVADLEGAARRLLDGCGLEWHADCLNFHQARRPVRTASVTQVRQPLYAHSVGRWKHYGDLLPSLFQRVAEAAHE
jgi:tetratricopeptide (TPR) repeat protein